MAEVFWNLRRVRNTKDGETRFHIREVYYDAGKPDGYADARFRDIVRLWRDWYGVPRLEWPRDFDRPN